MLVSCSAPAAPSSEGQSAIEAVACSSTSAVEAVDAPDPGFSDPSIRVVRQLGGFFRALRARTPAQHRSVAGPTFRALCREELQLRMLINVPEQSYSAVFIAFVDRAQVAFRLNGSRAVAHHMRLDSGETLVDLDFDPLPRGIHRLTLIVVDDDLGAGLFGYHDIAADIYVGAAPTRRPPPDPPPPTTRVEPQLQDYALWLTRDSERLQLVGTVTWPATTEVVVTISGSAREGEQVVLVALLQDFVTDRPAQPVRAMPGRVTVWRTALHAPKRTMESVRAVMLTNAWSDITSSGRSVRALLTQKAVLQRE